MTTLERDIEARLVDVVEAAGGRCLKWVCPGWSGVPDRICLLPGGWVIFAETKRPKGGRVAPLQHYWARVLRKLGFEHRFIHTYTDLDDLRERIRMGR